MNLITNKKLTKTLVLTALFVIIFTFIMPNYSIATLNDENLGGKLFRPIAQLLAFVADLSIELAQQFLWDGSTINADNDYRIYIGPATIFTGKIPRLGCQFYKTKRCNCREKR